MFCKTFIYIESGLDGGFNETITRKGGNVKARQIDSDNQIVF